VSPASSARFGKSIGKAVARLGLFGALIAGTGCVSSRAFVPAEHVTAFSPGGRHLAAEYSIEEQGSALGDVKVWSPGAERDGSAADPRTTVRVGFELANHDDAPLEFDTERLYLEEMAEEGRSAGRLGPTQVAGETLVPPGQTRQIDVTFALPDSVWPSDVPGYRVAWSVVGSKPHSRKTPFLRAMESRPVDPWYPYYGYYYPGYYYPGFYGSWSFGYRFGPPPPWRARRLYYVR
jgi:hypothetical protein